MNSTFIVAKREFRSNFDSPVGYVVIMLSLMIVGVIVFRDFWTVNRASVGPLFNYLPWALVLLIVPAVTMRLFAEEKRTGTIELLITMPVRDRDVVMGKYLASMGLIAVLLVLTVTYPVTIGRLGHLEKGPIVTGYLGLLLMSSAAISIGLFFSSLTENQIVAFTTTFVSLFALWVLDFIAGALGKLGDYLAFFSFQRHMNPFARGLVDLRHVLFFASITVFFLMLTTRSLESRKWK